jgi:hypothetical protein
VAGARRSPPVVIGPAVMATTCALRICFLAAIAADLDGMGLTTLCRDVRLATALDSGEVVSIGRGRACRCGSLVAYRRGLTANYIAMALGD